MKQLFLNKKFLIITGIIVCLTFIYSLLITNKNQNQTPQIINSVPTKNSQNFDVFLPLSLVFDKDVITSDLRITSSPQENWELSQIDRNTITISHKLALRPSTKYSLLLTWKNQPLDSFVFTTRASQGDPRLVQTLTEEFNRDYPLAKKTPYISDAYYVVYSAPMVLEITIKNPAITPEKAFSEIRAWVTSVGGDANAHKYVISDKPLPSTLPPTFTTSGLKPSSPSPTPFDWDNLKDDGT